MSFDQKVFREALDASMNTLSHHAKTKSLFRKFAGGYVCVASDTGGAMYLSSVKPTPAAILDAHRARCLENIQLLAKHGAWDLSREHGSLQDMSNAGAIRAVPYLFSFASELPGELNELLMFMSVVKAGLMSKEVARNRMYYFPTKYAQASENDVWKFD